MKTKKKPRAIILHEPFGFPKMPFGIYEVNEEGVPVRELGRAESKEKAEERCRQWGYVC